MALSGQAAMEAKMREVFQAAGKDLKFYRKVQPLHWIVVVDGKELSYSYSDEARAFQQALDKSGIGGKISYTWSERRSEWVFRYTPRKEA